MRKNAEERVGDLCESVTDFGLPILSLPSREPSIAGCYKRHTLAGFMARCPPRRPFLGSIRSGTLYAPIPHFKRSARKGSREPFAISVNLWISNGQTIWIVDARRDNGKRFVVHADEKLTAFLELESVIRAYGELI